ncbi:MAG: endonuclease III [Phycisphaerae bacterium]
MPKIAESLENRKKRARKILAGLRKLYPQANTALAHRDPLQLLVATILSAQSTDETVNKVTPVLFKRFKTGKALADAPREDIEEIIHSTGFFRQKAKNIQGACKKVADEFGGSVPDNMDDLLTLPGVARKTANVVLGSAFGKNQGVVVDTHVGRLATRLALTWSGKDSKDAVKIERDLMEILSRKDWTFVGHALIWHGRHVCPARKPHCNRCTLAKHCPSAHTFDESTGVDSKLRGQRSQPPRQR